VSCFVESPIAWLKPCSASEALSDGPVGGIRRVDQLAGLGLPKVGLWQISIMANIRSRYSYWQIFVVVMVDFLYGRFLFLYMADFLYDQYYLSLW
jgi:hypothetical protein